MNDDIYVEEKPKLEKPSLLGMIMEPRKQFERIKDNPKIVIPLVVVTVLTIIGMLLMMSQMDFIGEDPEFANMGPDELMIITIFAQITFAITGLFTPAISILISACIFFVIAKIVKLEVSFKQLFSMATFVYIISLLGLIVNAVAFFGMSNPDPELYLTSLNSIIQADGALGAFLVAIEIFTIWGLVLSAMGLQIVGKFSKGLSWGIVIGMFVIMTGFSVGTTVLLDMVEAL